MVNAIDSSEEVVKEFEDSVSKEKAPGHEESLNVIEKQSRHYQESEQRVSLKVSHELKIEERRSDKASSFAKAYLRSPSSLAAVPSVTSLMTTTTPVPTTPQGIADAIVKWIGPNRANLITNLKHQMEGLETSLNQDRTNYQKGFQPFVDKGQIIKHPDGSYSYDPHSLLPSVVNNILSLITADKKSFTSSFSSLIKSYLQGVANQVVPIQNFPYDKESFKIAVTSLNIQETQELIDEFYKDLQMGIAPQLTDLAKNIFPTSTPSPFQPKDNTNTGMDMMAPYIHFNTSSAVPLFPSSPTSLSPSITSQAALPFSSWWEILTNAAAKMVGIQVSPEGSTPVANPHSLSIDTIQTLYQRNPHLFPTYGANIENATKATSGPGTNSNLFLKDGTLTPGETVFAVSSAINGDPQPTGNQGIYTVGNTGTGIVFSNPETYSIGTDSNWDGRTLTYKPGYEMLAELTSRASPIFQNGPMEIHGTLTPTGENSVVYQQKQTDGSTLTIPIVKNSPYITQFTHDTSPKVIFDTSGAKVTGITTYQCIGGTWKQEGSPISSGTTPMGQLFRVAVEGPNTTTYYTVYADQPQSFSLSNTLTKRVVPDGSTMKSGDEDHFILYSDAVAVAKKMGITLPPENEMNWFSATIKVPSLTSTINTLEGTQGQGDRVLAISKIPLATVERLTSKGANPLNESYGLTLDCGIQYLPIQSDIKEAIATSHGSTSETTVQFYKMTYPTPSTHAYVGQLLNNFQTIEGAPSESDYTNGTLPYYQTLCGVERMIPKVPTQNSDGTYSTTLSYSDSSLYGLYNPQTSQASTGVDWMFQAPKETLSIMVDVLTDPLVVPSAKIWDQDYSLSQQIQTNALTALEAKTMLSLADQGKVSLTPQQKTQLTQVQSIFAAAAKDRLGVFLGSLSWDSSHNLLVSVYGNLAGSGNFYNNLGQDLQFTNGYMIHAAAIIRMLDPTYFQTPDSTTPYVWDAPKSSSIPNQAQYRGRIVDALVGETDPRPGNITDASKFPGGRQLDNETHLFKSHGWNIPTLDGQDLESTAEAINFSRGASLWCSLQAQGASDPVAKSHYVSNASYQLNHAIEGTRAAQTFRDPAYKGSIYLDPLSAQELKEYGQEIALSNITFVRQRTSDTYWGPGPKGFALAPFGAATMQGINMLGSSLDSSTAQKLVETLFYDVFFNSDKTPRTIPDWTQITQSDIFQNAAWQDPKFRGSIAIMIPTILPYVARYSPHLAKGVLDWYRQEHAKDPKTYDWHPGGNLATSMNYILEGQSVNEQSERWTDPVSDAEMNQITQTLLIMNNGNISMGGEDKVFKRRMEHLDNF
ncbi:MAG: hypothetical protein KFB93_03060 [Simkaniaceae bacterium]|nr:MAG: hypothetical protein KFB93_03060 [Simkaniaceae bacterium]